MGTGWRGAALSWGPGRGRLPPEVPGLQTLLSCQGSRVVPVRREGGLLKDLPVGGCRVFPQCSKVTLNLVLFQDCPYPYTWIKDRLSQHPTHSPGGQGGLCIPWGRGVLGGPSRGAKQTAELSTGSRSTPDPGSPPRFTLLP